MLQVENLHVRYGAITALRGVSLRVEPGRLVGLIGVNGAGKSTTLNATAGLVRPHQGRILFEGEDLVGKSPEEIFRRGIALVPEGRRIFPGLTVEEHLLLGAAIHRNRKQAAQDLERWCTMFPVLGERLKNPAGNLSGGQQQMVAIARALMGRPKILMLDEPSLGLAPKIVDELFELIQDLSRSGMTILLVEQNVRRTLEIADYAYLLTTGTVTREGPAAEILSDEGVQAAYLGSDHGGTARHE